MCQGNGYLGLRNATDEYNAGEQRTMFVAGTFNKFDESEVTELPNAADVTRLDIRLDGRLFQLQRVRITPLTADCAFRLKGGINGRMNNSGSQHFSEGEKRLYENRFMQYTQTTGQSKIDFFLNTAFRFAMDGEPREASGLIVMERRVIQQEFSLLIPVGKTLTVEKLSTVFTSRDRECTGKSFEQMQAYSLENTRNAWQDGYDALLKESAEAWNNLVWNNVPVEIDCADPFDQLAIRFAQYHLYVTTPAHDNRMNVAAKGLSGEAYQGHTFWDTEMFILPYFIYSAPEIARGLEEYRWLGLESAHKKAFENGYDSAQFPWEAAWSDDGEAAPVWCLADIVTGRPTKIWAGFIEQHITADVAYGVWQYYAATGDQEFMDQYGYELILDTAKFWVSRLELGDDGTYHINNVAGPDEYKEHVDDNAFTNYMAAWNIRKATDCAVLLKEENPALYWQLSAKLDLPRVEPLWAQRLPMLYLPQPRTDGVIPQDRTYLTLKDIDLSKYKAQEIPGGIYRDYNQEQISHMQVSNRRISCSCSFCWKNSSI